MRCNPWRWLWGLIPIAILTFLTVQWEHDRIEADLRQRTESALKAAGVTWAVTAFDGRDGLITGHSASDEGPQRALRVVRDVWGVRISDQRTQLLQKMDPYLWSAVQRGNRVRLAGYVPSEDVRDRIIGLAKQSFPTRTIDDRQELARGVPDESVWLGGIDFGMKQLAVLDTGAVSLRNTGFTIEGIASDLSNFKSVKGALRKMPTGVTLIAERLTPPTVSPFTWAARRKGNQIQLDGFVPDQSLREQIFAHAKKTFPRHAIVDRMEWANGAPAGLAAVARSALDQLFLLNAGEVTLSDAKVRIAGEAPDQPAAEKAVGGLRQAAKGFEVTEAITFPQPAPQTVSPYVIKIDQTTDVIVVTGHVPSEDARKMLIAAVRGRFPDREVRDELKLASGEPPRWLNCAEAGLDELRRLDNGSITISDNRLVLSGATREEALVDKLPGDLRASANRACETTVNISFDAPPEPELVWRATHDGSGKVVIDGEVLDARTRAALVQSATRYFPNAQIQDRMTIYGGNSEKWPVTAELGLKLLAMLRKGEAVLSRLDLLVRGEAKDTGVQTTVREQLSRAIPKGYSGHGMIEVRSDSMIWAEQEARRREAEKAAKEKAAADVPRTPEQRQRREEADLCQSTMREVATTGIIQFDWASDNLSRESRPTLNRLAEVARACPKAKIEIEGHTDAEGTPERNKNLSERRARAVYNYLAEAGIGTERLSAVGYGETRPIASNDTPANRAKNRRIEFSVTAE